MLYLLLLNESDTHTACAQLKEWEQNVITRDLALSINVSAKQFQQDDFAATVQSAIQRHAVNPTKLKLELTEGALVKNIDGIVETMNALRVLGIQFSMDDFGAGYSSLQYLKTLPLSQLKIDQSFVNGIVDKGSDYAIIKTIIAMADALSLNVIAEGVETEAQRAHLLSCGCYHYQGYLFGEPAPIEVFNEQLIKKYLPQIAIYPYETQ